MVVRRWWFVGLIAVKSRNGLNCDVRYVQITSNSVGPLPPDEDFAGVLMSSVVAFSSRAAIFKLIKSMASIGLRKLRARPISRKWMTLTVALLN